MKRLFFLPLILSFFMALPAIADDIKGRIIDAETNEPLPDAQIEFTMLFNTNVTMTGNISSDSLGCFFINVPFKLKNDHVSIPDAISANITIKVNSFGYNQLIKKISAVDGNDTINIGDLNIKPSDILLKEVTVKGHLRRFTMKGDTVIFNPEAFNLQEGERLQELLKKLPGVSFVDGQILWNGKPIQLKMNGHDIFGNGASLSELPADAVLNIKQYEQKSELAERTGNDDGDGKHVLDVNIKPEFMDKFYGDATLGKNTNEMYEASLQLRHLSDNNPIMLGVEGNRGNLIKDDNITWWGQDVRQQIGWINYQHQWDSKYKESKKSNSYSIRTTLNHYDEMTNDWDMTERFNTSDTIFTTKNNISSYNHNIDVPLFLTLYKNISNKTTLNSDITVKYKRSQESTNSEANSFESHNDSTELASKQVSNNFNDKKTFIADMNSTLTHYIDNGSITGTTHINYYSIDSDIDNHNDISGRNKKELDLQQGKNTHHHFNAFIRTSYNQWITKNYFIEGSYTIRFDDINKDNDIMRGNGINMSKDFSNNYRHKERVLTNVLELRLTQNVGKVIFTEKINYRNNNHWLDYSRANIDTTITRSMNHPEINGQVKWKMNKKSILIFSSGWSSDDPDLLSTIPFVDTSNKLYITEGNPNLKAESEISSNITWNYNIPKGEQNVNMDLSAKKLFNATMNLNRYIDGVYYTKAINGEGGHFEKINMQYNRSLGDNFYLDTKGSFSNAIIYSKPLVTNYAEDTEYLRQNKITWNIQPAISYSNNGLEIKLTTDIDRSINNYNNDNMLSTRLWNYSTRLFLDYKIKHWRFSMTPTLKGGRGYLSDGLNEDKFILDAKIRWNFAKNKCEVTLSADDILNNGNSLYSEITPEYRKEYGHKYYHHYVGLSFRYRIEPEKKK